MKRRTLLNGMVLTLPALLLARHSVSAELFSEGAGEKVAKGPFKPAWESLQTYQVPTWFRDAKFGMWAHWGPQCQPEAGDWYARGMYLEGSRHYNYHCEKYGHPSVRGFKDVIREWRAEEWDPEELVALYKKAGARYFFAMANHHDNFDMYDSKYQSDWNSTRIGPKRDIIGGWAQAARNQDLPFGVSVHASHAWSWYEPSQRSDKSGPYEGVPYDGKLTKADGKGKWWEGLDPQELYAQNHPLSANSLDDHAISQQWHWGNGVTPPSRSYIEKFFNRTLDLIDTYNPDLAYFDDSQLPFWPVSDAGLHIAAHMYNKSIKDHGELRAVIMGKILDESQRKALLWDIEKGQSNQIEPLPWQTCTCIGNWHYDRAVYDRKGYKSGKAVIHSLVDIVSKNGNLLLNIPVRGNGSIDEQERQIVEEVGRWMDVNGECIYGTRPWKIFGEGPAMEDTASLSGPGFNEGKGRPFGSEDVRFTAKGDKLYAIVLGTPEAGKIRIRSLSSNSEHYPRRIGSVKNLETGQPADFERNDNALVISFSGTEVQPAYAFEVS